MLTLPRTIYAKTYAQAQNLVDKCLIYYSKMCNLLQQFKNITKVKNYLNEK